MSFSALLHTSSILPNGQNAEAEEKQGAVQGGDWKAIWAVFGWVTSSSFSLGIGTERIASYG